MTKKIIMLDLDLMERLLLDEKIYLDETLDASALASLIGCHIGELDRWSVEELGMDMDSVLDIFRSQYRESLYIKYGIVL